MFGEKKSDIFPLLPAEYVPLTFRVDKADLKQALERAPSIGYPLIAKPDIGMKAFGVDQISSLIQLEDYLKKSPCDFLIQEFVPYNNEIGIFYSRHPESKEGAITGLVRKEFLSVTGDGQRTVLQLIKEKGFRFCSGSLRKFSYDFQVPIFNSR